MAKKNFTVENEFYCTQCGSRGFSIPRRISSKDNNSCSNLEEKWFSFLVKNVSEKVKKRHPNDSTIIKIKA